MSTRKSSIFSSDLTLSSPQAFDDHLRRCCSKITHTSFLTHRHIDLNSFTLLQYKVTLLHTWHSSPSIDKWKLRSTRKANATTAAWQVSVKPPVHARHAQNDTRTGKEIMHHIDSEPTSRQVCQQTLDLFGSHIHLFHQ